MLEQEQVFHQFRLRLKEAIKILIESKITYMCLKYGFRLKEEQQLKLSQFLIFLIEVNKKMNLTAIVEPDEIVLKHFIDSLMVEKLVKIDQNARVLDVGAGAGFPSIPIAIVRPDLKMVQIDCLSKRVKFLKQVSNLLNLKTEVVHGRAEELGKSVVFRERFNFVVARAVAPLNRLLEYCLPFVKVGGLFVALKGQNFAIEMEEAENAVKELGGNFEQVEQFSLGSAGKRVLILIRKISQTATKYPRINSKIVKSAL